MNRCTSIEELYKIIGAVVLESTGRPWWQKAGIQTRPNRTYANIFLTDFRGLEIDIKETDQLAVMTEASESFVEQPWGVSLIDCQLEFLQSAENDSALAAATRFKNALRLDKRYLDMWEVMGLVGPVTITDISAIFRADTEPRARVDFQFYANIRYPDALGNTNVYDINQQAIDVTHVRNDGVETYIKVGELVAPEE